MSRFDGIVRAGGSVLVQRVPALAGRDRALPTDAEEVGQLLADDAFADGVGRLAEKLGRYEGSVRAEAAGYLREMSGDHTDRSC